VTPAIDRRTRPTGEVNYWQDVLCSRLRVIDAVVYLHWALPTYDPERSIRRHSYHLHQLYYCYCAYCALLSADAGQECSIRRDYYSFQHFR